MRVVDDGIVVEVSLGGQSDRTPVLNQRLDCQFGGDWRLDGPGGGQAPVQRNGVEHLDVRPAFDDQALDNVDAVQARPGSGRHRANTTLWAEGPAGPLATVKCSAAAEDAVDGPHRGDVVNPLLHEGLGEWRRHRWHPGRQGPGLSESAKPDPPERYLYVGSCAAEERSDQSTRSSLLPGGPLNPVGDRGDTDAEPASDDTQRLTAADGSYHVSATLLLTLCLLMDLPHEGSV